MKNCKNIYILRKDALQFPIKKEKVLIKENLNIKKFDFFKKILYNIYIIKIEPYTPLNNVQKIAFTSIWSS